jgi:hypothetical protein
MDQRQMSTPGLRGYMPVNQLTSVAKLICDDSEAERLVRAMRRAGCPIVEETALRQLDA